MVTRPRSPNVQIYRPQLTSVLSFSHRMTGLFLSLGAVLLVTWLISAAAGEQSFLRLQAFMGSWLGLLLLFLWTFSLFYHLCNGIRHLFWDLGHGFQLRTIYLSGWSVVIASILLTLLAWLISLATLG